MNRTMQKKSLSDVPAPAGKPAGSGGAPPAAPAGVSLPLWARRRSPQERAVRPPSIARFPGLLCPPSPLNRGGMAL
jgi:hypothetical protein